MNFSSLRPKLGSNSSLCTVDRPVWSLSFQCPHCGVESSIAVSGRPPQFPVWQISPDPLSMLNSIKSGDIQAQWDAIWNSVTIYPSIQDMPHPRQVKCINHFTVSAGGITKHV